MTEERTADRAQHIRQAIRDIRALLSGKTLEQLHSDRFSRAALERFFEIISEASRYIPADWKAEFGPDVPWREVADLGNVLRHVYQRIELKVLWRIYQHDLGPLEQAVEAMLAAHDPDRKL